MLVYLQEYTHFRLQSPLGSGDENRIYVTNINLDSFVTFMGRHVKLLPTKWGVTRCVTTEVPAAKETNINLVFKGFFVASGFGWFLILNKGYKRVF